MCGVQQATGLPNRTIFDLKNLGRMTQNMLKTRAAGKRCI